MNTGLTVSIVTIVGALVLCGIIAWIVIVRTRKQSYRGVVVNKLSQEREGANDGSYTVYTIVVKTADGQEKKVSVGKKIWDDFQNGDTIVKEAGKFNPTKEA